MKTIDKLLNEDQKAFLLKMYVKTGITAATLAILPIEHFMRHLITVQGLDPETSSIERYAKDLAAIFNEKHDKSYDGDFDFSWATNKLKQVRKVLNKPELTEEQFFKATDVSNLTNPPNQVCNNEDCACVVDPDTAVEDIHLEENQHLEPCNCIDLSKFPSEVSLVSVFNTENLVLPNDIARMQSILDRMVKLGYCDGNSIAQEAQLKEISRWTSDALDSIERVLTKKEADEKH